MARLMAQLVFGVFLISALMSASARPMYDAPLTLSHVYVIGTTRITSEDVSAGLHLTVGEKTSRGELALACTRFNQLKLFYSARCEFAIDENSASLSISVKNDTPDLPVVFQNFVWLTRTELLKRLKQEIPFFMPDLPDGNGLQSEIISVLEKIAREHGIDQKVVYNDFWSGRGLYVFRIEGISTPVRSIQIEGENAPSLEETQKWSKILYSNEDYSAARLTWVIGWLVRDFYFTRGYMRPVVGQPRLEYLGKKDGTYPVRIIVPITPGQLYEFESVRFEGLAELHSSELLAKWKLNPGDPYDESYQGKLTSGEILTQPWAQNSDAEPRSSSLCGLINPATMAVSVIIGVEALDMWSKIKPGQKCGGSYFTLVFPPVP